MLASDYGLVTRRLALDVEYVSCPEGRMHEKVPVFAVGREQLYSFFGLLGREKSRSDNRCTPFYSDPSKGRYAVVIGAKRISDSGFSYDYSRTCYFWDVLYSIEDCADLIRNFLEVDSEDQEEHPGIATHFYEVWQICDDHDLWWEWETDSAIYWNDECYDNWLADVSDGPHSFPTVVKKSSLMSDEYIQRLKAANRRHLCQLREASEHAERIERCSFCNAILYKPYKYRIDEGCLVCRGCWLEYWFDLEAADADWRKDNIKEEGFVYVEGVGYC